jgi:hypothetical protein
MTQRRYTISVAAVVLLGVAALSGRWLARLRPSSPELRARYTIAVISGADSGAGTLREALFTAAKATERVRIRLHPKRIVLRTPLPPVTGAAGVVLDAEESHCEIDGVGVPGGPLLDISSPATTVAGVRVSNAREQGIIVRANHVLLRGVTVSRCGDGVIIATGVSQTIVERSTFDSNTIGIRVSPPPVAFVAQDNEFRRNEEAGIWAAAPTGVGGEAAARMIVRRNRFRGDRLSIALINIPGLILANEIQEARETGIYLLESRSVVRQNRIHNSALGIVADSVRGAIIEQNEIDRARQVGLLVRNSRNTLVTRNRLYSNAYGLAVVFGDRPNPDVFDDNLILANMFDGMWVVGASPLLRHNDVVDNRGAAARVLDFVPWDGPRIAASPRLEGNTFRANAINDAIRGEYRPRREEERQ